ncbi:MAG TPA: hypothetical protein VMX38_07610 [Verrucomicrobiae bacterium]|jgi:hypothetical protein|nr:hypothetical protein [Verrucomicrobiae bacterium]
MKSSLRSLSLCLAIASCAMGPLAARAQEGPLDTSQPNGITPDEIIKRFAAKETEFAKARDQYTYRQDVKVETLDGDTVDGQYREVFDVMFDDKGHRVENVVFAPASSLKRIFMSEEDLQDIRHRLPFVLTEDELPEYNILYVGQQKEDELHCFVFDIAPKKIEGKKRYFQGRVWVDDEDYQIVKTYGKTVPDLCNGKPCSEVKRRTDNENLFPKFTTWRQQIDGQYWFPVFTKADDELHFNLEDVHIVEIVKYEDYKRFGSNVKILYDGKQIPNAPKDQKPDQQPGQQPNQQAPQQQTPPPQK